jgi:iron uptake system EfeUOB component EfeO/EfeM
MSTTRLYQQLETTSQIPAKKASHNLSNELVIEEKELISEKLYTYAEILYEKAKITRPDYQKETEGYKVNETDKVLYALGTKHNLSRLVTKYKEKMATETPDELIKKAINFLQTAIDLDHHKAKTLLVEVKLYQEQEFSVALYNYALHFNQNHFCEETPEPIQERLNPSPLFTRLVK